MWIPRAPDEVKECNCSICRRTGALLAYYSPKDVRVIPPSGATDIYRKYGDYFDALLPLLRAGAVLAVDNVLGRLVDVFCQNPNR